MKIFLFGSIAAGKTVIAKEIINTHGDFTYIAIDDFRRKHGDGSMKKEFLTRQKFIESIQPVRNQVVEASGLGELGYEITQKASFMEEAILVVIIYLEENLIKKRLEKRKWDIPFPGGKSKLEIIIKDINKGIESNEILLQWSKLKNACLIKTRNQTADDKAFIVNTIDNFIKTYQHVSRRNN